MGRVRDWVRVTIVVGVEERFAWWKGGCFGLLGCRGKLVVGGESVDEWVLSL